MTGSSETDINWLYVGISCASCLVVGATGGLTPYWIAHGVLSPSKQRLLSLLNCFAGGVLLAAGFAHMLPDAMSDAEALGLIGSPTPTILVMVGLLIPFGIEKSGLAHVLLNCSCGCHHCCDKPQRVDGELDKVMDVKRQNSVFTKFHREASSLLRAYSTERTGAAVAPAVLPAGGDGKITPRVTGRCLVCAEPLLGVSASTHKRVCEAKSVPLRRRRSAEDVLTYGTARSGSYDGAAVAPSYFASVMETDEGDGAEAVETVSDEEALLDTTDHSEDTTSAATSVGLARSGRDVAPIHAPVRPPADGSRKKRSVSLDVESRVSAFGGGRTLTSHALAPVRGDHVGTEEMDVDVVPYLLVFVLGIHSLLAGTSLGASAGGSVESSVGILVGILFHKGFSGLALGMSFRQAGRPFGTALKMVCLFAAMTPAGIVVGAVATSSLQGANSANTAIWVQMVFKAIAAGTFVFVAVVEVLCEELDHGKPVLQQGAAFLVGCGAMSVLGYYV